MSLYLTIIYIYSQYNMFKKKNIFNFFFITIISNIGNFCTFGYQIVLARSMDINSYGLFNSMMAYYSLLSIPFILIPYTIVKFSNQVNTNENKNLVSLLIYICLLIFISQITLLFFWKKIYLVIFKNEDILNYILVLVFFVLSFLFLIPSSFTLAKNKYKFYTIFVSGPIYLKFLLILMCSFLFHKIEVNTAILINILSILFFLLYINLKKNIYIKNINETFYFLKKNYKYFLGITIVIATSTFLQHIDIVSIRYLFDEKSSGEIAGAIFMGKIPFYFFSIFSIIIFPELFKKKNLIFLKFDYIFKNYLILLIISIISFFLLELTLKNINIIQYFLGKNFVNSKNFFPLTFFYYFQLFIFIMLTNIFIKNHHFNYILYIILPTIIFFIYAIKFSIIPKDYFITKNYLIVLLNFIMIFLIKLKKK